MLLQLSNTRRQSCKKINILLNNKQINKNKTEQCTLKFLDINTSFYSFKSAIHSQIHTYNTQHTTRNTQHSTQHTLSHTL